LYFIIEGVHIYFLRYFSLCLFHFNFNFSLAIFHFFKGYINDAQMFMLLFKLHLLSLVKCLHCIKLRLQLVKLLLQYINLLATCKFLLCENFHLNEKTFVNERILAVFTLIDFFFRLLFCSFKFTRLLIEFRHLRLDCGNLSIHIKYRRLCSHYLHL